MTIQAIIFDLGNTLVQQQVDTLLSLDKLNLVPLPYVETTIAELAESYRLGLLTNTTRSSSTDVRLALDHLGLGRSFSAIVTSFDHGIDKPDPRIFMQILTQLGVRPDQAVMVGNDRTQDIQAARSVGLHTAFFTPAIDPDFAIPDFQFTDYRSLPQLIAELDRRLDDGLRPTSAGR